MPYNLHGDTERARETLWARKEDAKAMEALRRRIEAETAMVEKLQEVKAQGRPKG